ncbi:galactosyl transferase GMA12/MNN10 family-domain-containing protein [Amylocarpus encephaloides]|uniref:Galactosyl transferase GMA12/MNN10 family-domain-containing protein n=1 Tax=Amylocarpus encephaloides TaxID=45428 RepID=A0A9P7YA56_9HELO|nr:galactosyl transferase GMA12/MNN10 family-domain-containing protein [Amylocarpus encephaloides]
MHLAFPSRKTSNPPQYLPSRTPRFPTLRRSRVQAFVVGALVVGAVLWLISSISGGGERIPSGTPPVVIVTVVDEESYGQAYVKNVKENRREYAKRHGYTTFFPSVGDYDLGGSPVSWAKVPACRHAITKFPHTTYIWYLDQNSFIMNPELKVESHIMEKKRLESLMIKNQPIVPPDSVIKTWPHLKGENIEFALTQDKDGLAQGSFIVRRGEWAKFFLDTWFDPLYRSYNFQKADTHALEHIVQWHPTILSKLVLIPQRTLNAYNPAYYDAKEGQYTDGDFVVRFAGCDTVGRDCIKEAEPFSKQWRTIFYAR